jgi:tetraacyldisaccharide 4'-kinase
MATFANGQQKASIAGSSMKTLVDHWYSSNPLLRLLLPFSFVYRIGCFFHRFLYRSGIKKKYQTSVPIVVIGNMTVGGTGKTPLVIELAKFLIDHGYQPGIVSRGYKAKGKKFPQRVLPESNPQLVGDEPVLLAIKTACPVVIDPKRGKAVDMLLKQNQCNVIISDDGLQHYGLERHLEIVIVDGERQFGNGFCLPAGPLREPLKRLSRVDFILENTDYSHHFPYTMKFLAEDIVNLVDKDLIFNKAVALEKNIHAVAGIGNPNRFFNMLREMGLPIREHRFPDHYIYREEDFAFCSAEEIIIMTEKDAIKCKSFAKNNYWVLPIRSQVSSEFLSDFFKKLSELAF